jgi:transposase-like protein
MSDPYFRGRPIDSLSTTEQTRANQVYNKVQQAQLRNLGIEPTEENMRGSQLLGARGLKRYLENGTFSNEAARANGGAQNLERIVKARMGGQSAPSSQPNLPPQPVAPAPEAAAPAPQPEAAAPAPAPDVRTGGQVDKNQQFNDVGGASRFFYCAKASKSDRGIGNTHPTVKPIKLMEYLIKLVTPPNGICVDPFSGSGTTAVSSMNVGVQYIGFELDENYYNIAQKRIEDVLKQAKQ